MGTDSGTGDGPAVAMVGMAWPGTGIGDTGMADAVRLAAGWGRSIGFVGGGCTAHHKEAASVTSPRHIREACAHASQPLT